MILSILALSIDIVFSFPSEKPVDHSISYVCGVTKITQHGRVMGMLHGQIVIGFFPVAEFFGMAGLTGGGTDKRSLGDNTF